MRGYCPKHLAQHVTIQPQPEQWFKELEIYKKSATEAIMTFDPRHTFCTVCGTDPEALVARLNEVVASLLFAQKEQMLESLRWMKDDIKFVRKMVPGGQHTLDSCQGCSQTWSSCVCVERNIGYNSALEDVEEKIKKL